VLFAEVAATSDVVAATSSRSAKRDALADLLRRLDRTEVGPVVAFLVGEPRQGRIGIGWRTLSAASNEPADGASLTISEVDATITRLEALSGPGSVIERRALLSDLLGRATVGEASFLARLLGGELRQGSLTGVMTDAVAVASGVQPAAVRRAVMLGGRLDAIAELALAGGAEALSEVGLELGRPLQPMLASTAASVSEAVAAIGLSSVEWKLDGIRIQVHRTGDDVRIWTRNLNEITDRLPGIVELVRGLPVDRVVLDGEALAFDADDRPLLFQDTVSGPTDGSESGLRPYFFDVLHVDGVDLIDVPLRDRQEELERVAAGARVPAVVTDDPDVGEAVLVDALAAGHEGVVVKAADSGYEAGRRGKAWRKVKPVHTLDLVVLGAEWGHGRRQGWLSNLHLGARADDGSGFVMVGKTFKGLTDELLRWQTERFVALAADAGDGGTTLTDDTAYGVVLVPPVQVVEIALDGAQRSTRYPGGVALRFARVVRYRDDKDASEADLLSAVQAMIAGGPPGSEPTGG
jgi:DNA ligase-1